jgi:hypothetical protein
MRLVYVWTQVYRYGGDVKITPQEGHLKIQALGTLSLPSTGCPDNLSAYTVPPGIDFVHHRVQAV